MLIFESCGKYVQSCTTLVAKIVAIDAIIEALEIQALDSVATNNLLEYKLNDGQTIIQETYRGAGGIAKAIGDFEIIKQRYVNRLNGRMHRLVDGKNFRGNGYY